MCRRQRGRVIVFYHRFLERIKAGQPKAFQTSKGGEERISESKQKQERTASRVYTSIGERCYVSSSFYPTGEHLQDSGSKLQWHVSDDANADANWFPPLTRD